MTEAEKIIDKFADYCACDEYHYTTTIDGGPGNHDPSDGHMEFDEEKALAALSVLVEGCIGDYLPTKDRLGREYPSDSPAGQKARIWNLAKDEIRNDLRAAGVLK